jgi:hypothetical protein
MKSVYATFLGGNGFEEGNGIAVDSTGNAYVTGWTWSSDFPTQDALYPHHHGYKDAFVAKFNASGKAVYSTYLGGGKDDVGQSIAVDKAGNAYLVGSTKSSDFPLKDALSANLGGDADAFLVKLDAGGTTLVYASYLGGKGYDEGKGIAVDNAGNAYLTGQTRSADFPKSKALYPNLRGGGDAFIVIVTP